MKGPTLGSALSENETNQARNMGTTGFLQGSAPVAMSCEVGQGKPDTGIYQFVLNQLQLPSEAVAYVDDLPEYMKAASLIGIQAVLHTGDAAATREAILRREELIQCSNLSPHLLSCPSIQRRAEQDRTPSWSTGASSTLAALVERRMRRKVHVRAYMLGA